MVRDLGQERRQEEEEEERRVLGKVYFTYSTAYSQLTSEGAPPS